MKTPLSNHGLSFFILERREREKDKEESVRENEKEGGKS